MDTSSNTQPTASYSFPLASGIISIGMLVLAIITVLGTTIACSGVYECGLGWITMGVLFFHVILVTPVVIILAIIGIVKSTKLSTRRTLCITLNSIGLAINIAAIAIIVVAYILPMRLL